MLIPNFVLGVNELRWFVSDKMCWVLMSSVDLSFLNSNITVNLFYPPEWYYGLDFISVFNEYYGLIVPEFIRVLTSVYKYNFRFDPVANAWTTGPSLNRYRSSCGLVANGSSLWALGGNSGYNAYVNNKN